MEHLIRPSEHNGMAGHAAGEAVRRRSLIWDLVETFLIASVLFVVIRGVILNYRVDGSSMEPTLHNGEMLLVNRRAYVQIPLGKWLDALPFLQVDRSWVWTPFGLPKRGDIIVFRPPNGGHEPYVKRIIALPGEHVEIRDGAVYINRRRLIEPYLNEPTLWRGMAAKHEIIVEPGHVFVMGDNRNNSSDSRVFGTIPTSAIIGKAWITYWPPREVKILGTPAYALE